MKKENMDKRLLLSMVLGSGMGIFMNSDNPVFFAWGILALAVSLVLAVKVIYEELILKKKGTYVAKEYEEFDLGSKFAKIQLIVLICILVIISISIKTKCGDYSNLLYFNAYNYFNGSV